MVQHISAVTFAVQDMSRSVAFYVKAGFEVVHGGPSSVFTTLRSGNAVLNLTTTPDYEGRWWGRVIFRVDDANTQHEQLRVAGLNPPRPSDGPWGERFFHIHDPDGHELSFAQLLPVEA